MRTAKAIILVILLTQFSNTALGQVSGGIDSLICKEWKLAFYEEEGEKFPPSPEYANDIMVFYPDYTVKSVETGKIQNGIWEYDPTEKLLSVVDDQTKEKAIMKVLKITKDECILEYEDPDGALLKMYLVPTSKK